MVKFGVQLWQEKFNSRDMKRAVKEVEGLGFDSAWIYDHFYPMSYGNSWNIAESWTLLPVLAECTENMRHGVLVTCNSYRHPAILAKIAATVDVISEGRLEFGIGAGWHDVEYEAYGIPFLGGRARVERLAEAVELIKKIWTEDEVSFDGKYYKADELISLPEPVQEPYPTMWIGGKENMLLRIVAEHADYSNFSGLPPSDFGERCKVLKNHCEEIGRDYGDIGKRSGGIMEI